MLSDQMKILAVFTGGTISCSESGGVLSPDKGNSFLLLKSRPDVCFDALMPYTILSENLGAEELEQLIVPPVNTARIFI